MELLHDIKISGYSHQSGGTFNYVKIAGKGVITGDVEAKQIKVDGAGTFCKDVKSAEMNVNGTGSIEGNLEVKNFKVHGNCTVKGSGTVEKLSSKGKCSFQGDLKSNKISSVGHLAVDGGVETEEFISLGGFEIKGLLNAQLIDIKIGWRSYAEEIGGEEIYVKLDNSRTLSLTLLSKWLGRHSSQRLKSKVIEGTKVDIEFTEADVVRGNHVYIGPGCRIAKVEYTDTLEVNPNSTVIEQIKI
ncbi:polymer-forming cytoskeletal protein [Paenactinomyces guangxiensis]|uniref:Polymer-forming cytoskeletal protein n=1 Tax=Paenactinomyces guangxiensis TaxID=1490290 RepID=A0A7W2A9I1_9BACL|nr:polymer-forming cytoskeletal protein [Paenactinomyces guangxiensis]MBA4495212.1 polymer-forming cytoskeletal protein [Paenactinomyces guangxiensis]MBH8592296.1 polymer-forming cytoskeletal protein [Paenactinomyces guangxiensis]